MDDLKRSFEKISRNLPLILALLFIICIAIWIRLGTINSPTVLDYDPWWFYRYAQMILNNGMKLPSWDIQSFYPGRPVSPFQGWPYTIVFLYKILSSFSSITLMKAAIISPLFMVALIVIAAFFAGRLLSNNLGGLVTAFFVVLAPSLIGTSMAGYCDTDAPVAFYFFFSIFTTLLALKKKSLPAIIFSIIANLLFIWNWGGGWLTLILFVIFTFALLFFKIFENFVHTFSFKLNFKVLIREWFDVSKPIFIIVAITNILGFLLFHSTLFLSFFGGLAFTGLGFMLRGAVLLLLFGWCGLFAYNFFQDFLTQKMKTKFYSLLSLLLTIFLAALIVGAFISAPESPLLVNVSVAELQPVNIFSKEGFVAVANRVGLLTTLLSFGLLVLAVYKIWKKEKIIPEEIFLFLSTIFMFLLISRGVRFDLQFTVVASIAAGYMIGNYKKYPLIILALMTVSLILLPQIILTYQGIACFLLIASLSALACLRNEEILINVLIFAIFAFQALFFISNAIQLGQQGGMEISKNWYDALDWLVNNSDNKTIVATWWDPGHILAGYSYYKQKPFMVMADGAHCGPTDCLVYNHNIRIQDMGRAFSTSNETEALNILKKYMGASQEQCEKMKKEFNGKIYDNPLKLDPCKPMEKMFVIASNDLIGKYYWLSFFSSCEKKFGWQAYDTCSKSVKWFLENAEGKNFFTLPFSNFDQAGNPVYAGIITLGQVNNTLVGVYQNRYIIRRIIYFQGGTRIAKEYNVENSIDGLLWVDPSFGLVIFMEPEVYKSLFTNMFFFNGQGLEEFGIPKLNNFELKFSNPEVKIFRVIF
jgi:asparagine N-glycosylation enzyme membrane subunit Stt3